ncbi:MoaD/ThiS family protein [Agromyces intestinalis]|uniref:MoaD/ThiS family protein n=2 Tax=Agromyces TaxID=33877 RepID=A0A5C1YCI7_9MICO|nr:MULTISPECIES: MoaD/ThiS family protein [Agromyces]QEO13706.1 MoaD/ThiS family protein [Agromyces intestinalis]UOE44270.1 MoaD/ThiS family protein [Agromyces larvae]
MARVRLFAAAADAAGTEELSLEASDLGSLLAALRARGDDRLAHVLDRSSFLVDGSRTSEPATPLAADALVDVMPPFAGG